MYRRNWLLLSLIFITCFCPIPARAQNSEQELFVVAQKAFEDGFYDIAARYIDQLLKEYPQTEKRVPARLLLGQCYFFKSQYLKAYETFHPLLDYSEFKDATLFWLGETYLKGSDYLQAEKQFQQLIDIYPNSEYTPQAYYSLGWTYFAGNKLEEAKKPLKELLKEFPDHQFAEDALFKLGEIEYNLHNYQEAVRYFSTYSDQYPQSARIAESYFYIGEAHYYLEDFLTAVTYYAKAAQGAYDEKLTLMAKVSLGWSYLKLGKYDLAKNNLEEAVEFSRQKGIASDDVYLGLASLYYEMKVYDQAMAAYTQLIENFADSSRLPEAYLGRANIYYQLQKYSEAMSDYQQVISKFANNAADQDIVEKAYFGLAWSYLKIGEVDESIKTFQAIKDQSTNKTVKISALTQIGDAYQDLGELEKAVTVYDQILSGYPDSVYSDYVQYRQGIALLKMDRIEAATLSFQGLQTNFPQSKYLHDTDYYLALAYFKKGNWTAARQYIHDFIENLSAMDSLESQARYILGLSEFNMQNHEAALKVFQQIIKNYPQETSMVNNCEINTAKCYYKMGRTKEALKIFKSLADQYPQTEIAEESLLWMGDHALESLEFDNAAGYYEKLIREFPKSDRENIVLYHLAEAYEGKEEYDRAVGIFRQIDKNKDSELYAKAELAIADIFSREIDQSRAVETYENIIENSPEFKRDAYIKIARVYTEQGEYARAVTAYQNAIQSQMTLSEIPDAELQFSIGDSYERLNQLDKAVEEYFKIPYLYSQEVSWVVKAYLRIARLLEKQEKWEDAKIIYHKIIALKTDEMKFAQERLEWIKENVKK